MRGYGVPMATLADAWTGVNDSIPDSIRSNYCSELCNGLQ